jgi:hypothetical protein
MLWGTEEQQKGSRMEEQCIFFSGHDKDQLVSAVPDYFFVLGLATITEAVSKRRRILRIPWDCII